MSSTTADKYFLSWNEHANNFPISFSDLLQSDELVDVQLVAEGHLISAHRLVLSAMSPYFRKMFTQMPANQQAFVFLKDISEQTVIELITFIYRGEVNVKQEHLDEFMKAAIALNIKGLNIGNVMQPFDSRQPISTPTVQSTNGSANQTPYFNNPFGCSGVQYQGVQHSAQSVALQQPVHKYQEKDDFKSYEMSQMDDGLCYVSNNDQNYSDDDSNSNNRSMCDNNEKSLNQWNNDIGVDSNDTEPKSMVKATAPKRKRMNTSEFNIVADIQDNHKGSGHLFYANAKFQKHGKISTNGIQRWQCTKAHSQKCRAAMRTIEINGVTMMKILTTEHTHVN